MKSLFGYSVTTKGIAKKGSWYIFDDKFKTITYDEYNNTLLPSSYFNPNDSYLEITSPGIKPNHFLIKKAKNLITDIDYYFHNNLQIWVTGTNGKTTTVEMIHYLIKESEMGGNIGIPVSNLKKNKIWVLEVSSFQLYYTRFAKPNIFVVLPINQDHLSWHGNMENYINAKLAILNRLRESDIVIMPREFDRFTKAKKILYSNENDLIKMFNLKNINFSYPFKLDEVLAKVVYKILFFEERSLENFIVGEHKLELLRDKFNRLWINDSKATNIDATIAALKAFKDKKIYLILGGDDKGQNFEVLFNFLKKLDIELYLIGKSKDKLSNLSSLNNIPFFKCKSLQDAVEKISNRYILSNSIALLSPACSSLDSYSSYKERGNEFKKFINSI